MLSGTMSCLLEKFPESRSGLTTEHLMRLIQIKIGCKYKIHAGFLRLSLKKLLFLHELDSEMIFWMYSVK